jgi:transcriptional regulator with XRE-family HTH domain
MVSVVEAGFLNECQSNHKTKKSSLKFQMRVSPKNLVGSQIRQLREKRGWTQRQLSESFRKAGIPITRDIIASIETQRCAVTDYQIVFFARVLGASWKSLFPNQAFLKSILPPANPKKKNEPTSNATTGRPKPNSSASISAKMWSLCELSCKSLKMTFRGQP